MTPLIKWVGGKTKLLPELRKRMPPRYRAYYEPFFGGGALFFDQAPPTAIPHHRPSIIGDANLHLWTLYLAVARDVERVIRSLQHLERQHHGAARRQQRVIYETIRDLWNDGTTRARWEPYRKAATLLYLNRTCFNGLWRENKSGQFNVPMGDYAKGHTICDAATLRAGARLLERTVIRCGDYWNNCRGAKDGDFVYFDPPYDPVTPTANFTSYNAGGFSRQDQDLLACHALELIENGAQVMLSNSDTRYIRSLYRGFALKGKPAFKLHRVKAPRSINSNGAKRGKVGELIITGGYEW